MKVHHNSSVTGRPMAQPQTPAAQGLGSRGSIKKIITYYSIVMLIDLTIVTRNNRLFSYSIWLVPWGTPCPDLPE